MSISSAFIQSVSQSFIICMYVCFAFVSYNFIDVVQFHEGVERLMRVLEAEGVTQTLKSHEYGAKPGDLVTIGEWDFVF